MNTTTALTEEQVQEFQTVLGEIKGGWANVKDLPATFKTIQDETAQLGQQMKDVRRLVASRLAPSPRTRTPGLVSDECARHLAAQLVVHCHKSDRLSGLCSVPAQRAALIDFACNTLNLATRAALNTNDIPLPTEDGGGTYESVKGIVQIARDNTKTVVLAATKTKPSDATLDDFRTLRTKCNKAALSGRLSAYYLDTTWETRLPSFRTAAEPNVYQRLPDGSALLDGYPIVWTDVLTAYGTSAAADSPLAVFGALSFWWMGEHGSPRIDTSEHVWFANDQLAVRFIEEIDFDYAAVDATAALITAAS